MEEIEKIEINIQIEKIKEGMKELIKVEEQEYEDVGVAGGAGLEA